MVGTWKCLKYHHITNKQAKFTSRITHRVKEVMRSALVKFNPALYLVKFPVAVSKATSAPRATAPLPITPEKLTTGFAVKPMLVLIPA